MALILVSLNVRGLRDFVKRKDIFLKIKEAKYDIAFLQECHSTPEDEFLWSSQWGGGYFLIMEHVQREV